MSRGEQRVVLATHKYNLPVPLGVTANSTHLFSSPWELRESHGTHKGVCCHSCRVARAQKDDDKSLVSGFLRISSVMMCSAIRTINLSTSFGRSGLSLIILMVLILLLPPPPQIKNEKQTSEPKNTWVFHECLYCSNDAIQASMPKSSPLWATETLGFSSETVPTFIRVQFYLYFLRTPSPFLLFPLCLVL